MTTTALLETLITTELPLAQHSQLIGAVLEGQEGASATVKVNGVAATYPVTLSAADTLRIERPVGEIITRLYGQPGPNAGTGPKGDPGAAATVTVGTVTTGAPGTQAQVTNSGTTSAAVLDFVIPRGADGTSAPLDVEAIQDVVGQMLGEVQGHYDDAAGTYTVNLPTGGALDTEQVQDIVGALIRAGSNATVTYDDTANALTIAAQAGGGSLPEGGLDGYVLTKDSASGGASWRPTASSQGIRLRDIPPVTERFYPVGTGAVLGVASTNDVSESWEKLQALAPFTIRNLEVVAGWREDRGYYASIPAGTRLSIQDENRTEIAYGIMPTWNTPYPPALIVTLSAPVSLSQNQVFYLVSDGVGGFVTPTSADATTSGGVIKFISSPSFNKSPVNFASGTLQKKQVIGPVDPADFPISTTAAAPNKSGFMVVDDAAKTASLYWKFSDGTTKKLDLT